MGMMKGSEGGGVVAEGLGLEWEEKGEGTGSSYMMVKSLSAISVAVSWSV